MAARTSPSIVQPLPAERFFRVSLFLLLLTAILTLVGTGKIDLFTSIVATFALLYRVRRQSRPAPGDELATPAY